LKFEIQPATNPTSETELAARLMDPGFTSDDELARSTGGYFYHQRSRAPNRIADDVGIQEELLAECGRISGIPLTD
jgi:hypothetical protein